MKRPIHFILLAFLIAFSLPAKAINDGSHYAASSVLADGKWVQLKVKENAIYKLSYEDIKKMGFADPAKIKLYGYGGWMLSEDFTAPYIDDLPEVRVWMNKGNDGVFGAGDYLLFYGRGVTKWSFSEYDNRFVHETNPYATYGSYFLTESNEGPAEMELLPVISEGTPVSVFDDYLLHEQDQHAVLQSGRELFGEDFLKSSQREFTFTAPGITSDAGSVTFSFAAAPPGERTATLTINGDSFLSLNLRPTSTSYEKAVLETRTKTWTGEKPETIKMAVQYNSSGSKLAYLNYISLNIRRQLRAYGDAYLFFRHKDSGANQLHYTIANASASMLVWDITNTDTQRIQTQTEGSALHFGAQTEGNVREYVLVDPSKSFPTPEVVGEVPNQNLHALPQTDMVIIVPKIYRQQADRLAERHREQSGLTVQVVQPEWIYNEFSSGTRDATAYRRFMKMFYDRAENEDEKPRYLLLFGKGVFDNRHLTTDGSKLNPNNYLLSYQFRSSVNETTSYGTDDYFGFLDDTEGIALSADILDIGIGRFPVTSLDQAKNAVDKVLRYMDNNLHGDWKNRLIFTADDTDELSAGSSFCLHGKQAERLSNYLETTHPEYMIVKSFMDAYAALDVNGKKTYPDAKKKFLSNLNDGCLLLNYTGHGSTAGWSGEDMLYITDVQQMRNERLPLWITATCDFGWPDGFFTSGGEAAFLNKSGGAIALYTTSRVVYASDNYNINDKLVRNLFGKTDGKRPRLGDVLRISKAQLGNESNKLNYVLLGDPALQLNYPEYTVELETINGETADSDDLIELQTLEEVVLEGTIRDETGAVVTNFNGEIRASVFDGSQEISSVRSDSEGDRFFFQDYPFVAFKGPGEVKEGRFKVSFTVPLDIAYTNRAGKMNFYASDAEQRMEAQGAFRQYVLSGTGGIIENNGEGPTIKAIYLNDSSFKDGDKVNATPYFVAEVEDKDGINMSGSGLGHDIQLIIDNSPTTTYVLNAQYIVVSRTEGQVRFSIPELEDGKHQLVFRVWDILNNASSDTLNFEVKRGLAPEIYDLTAGPNPARESTVFRLSHNRPETTMEVTVSVYDLSGLMLWSHTEKGMSSWLNAYPIDWDLTDLSGRRLAPGIYLYKATIKTKEGEEGTKAKKMIILEQ